MNRRSFFAALAGLPFVNRFAPNIYQHDPTKTTTFTLSGIPQSPSGVVARRVYGANRDGTYTELTRITDPDVHSVSFENGKVNQISKRPPQVWP